MADGISQGLGGISGELALKRTALLVTAWGDRLPAALRSGTVPNAFGEGGSPADGG